MIKEQTEANTAIAQTAQMGHILEYPAVLRYSEMPWFEKRQIEMLKDRNRVARRAKDEQVEKFCGLDSVIDIGFDVVSRARQLLYKEEKVGINTCAPKTQEHF